MLSAAEPSLQERHGTLSVGPWRVRFNNAQGAQQTAEEIFQHNVYAFKTTHAQPFIIDAGSHIGLSTLFFKRLYPQARIVCFEPDPNAFDCLQHNVITNQLKEVTLVRAAVTTHSGSTLLFGDGSVDAPDSRGNSIERAWGWQRSTSTARQVAAVRLGGYVEQRVDFLKLDIEGAEQAVLEDLGDRIERVQALAIEVHEIDAIADRNRLEAIQEHLLRHGFSVQVQYKDAPEFPDAIADWAKREKPRLFLLTAQKISA